MKALKTLVLLLVITLSVDAVSAQMVHNHATSFKGHHRHHHHHRK